MARGRRFVGREAELELFREAVEAAEPEFVVLWIFGPGGVGKTTLLEAFADDAAGAGVELLRLDMRAIDPAPPAFGAALAEAAGVAAGDDPVEAFADGSRRVLLLDTYEAAAPLDGWLRDSFLPELPARTIVVIAGRMPPGEEWVIDAGWRDAVRAVSLRNLDRDDARAFLRVSGVDEALHDRALALTHGHPLALALLGDVLAQDRGAARPLDLAAAPDVVRPLLERFAAGVPSARHREALHVAAHAHFTTEALLHDALGGDVPALFAWLRGLSFVEEGPHGLFPHDLARDVLDADLRWRDPDAYADLHQRVRTHLRLRIVRSEGPAQRLAASGIVFLHRGNSLVNSFWDWETFGRGYADTLRPGDHRALLEMTECHEGSESAALVERWLARQPHGFIVMRVGPQKPIGFALMLALHEATGEDRAADPGAAAMWEYAQRHGAPRLGDEVFGARFLIDRDAYQAPSLTQNLITIFHTQHIVSRPRLAWDFVGAYTDPDSIELLFAYIDYHRAREAEYEVGGLRYGVFAHDWRRLDADRWLEMMGERELGLGFDPDARRDEPALMLALSQQEFTESVRRALRDLHRPEALAANPLMRSRAVRNRGGEQPTPDALRDLVSDAIDALRVSARDEKLHRALARTYVRPAATQELAAEALGLPFGTYRHHLARATERVVEWLWQRELYGARGLTAPAHAGQPLDTSWSGHWTAARRMLSPYPIGGGGDGEHRRTRGRGRREHRRAAGGTRAGRRVRSRDDRRARRAAGARDGAQGGPPGTPRACAAAARARDDRAAAARHHRGARRGRRAPLRRTHPAALLGRRPRDAAGGAQPARPLRQPAVGRGTRAPARARAAQRRAAPARRRARARDDAGSLVRERRAAARACRRQCRGDARGRPHRGGHRQVGARPRVARGARL